MEITDFMAPYSLMAINQQTFARKYYSNGFIVLIGLIPVFE